MESSASPSHQWSANRGSRPLALITGGSRGIGAALAERFALEGWDLFLVARDPGRLDQTAHTLRSVYGINVITLAIDLATQEGPGRLLDQLDEMRLEPDALVNNAAIGTSGRFIAGTRSQWAEMLDVNVRALTLLTHGVLPGMLARDRGRILNVASLAAFQPIPGMSLYAATKAFVLSFSEALSEEVRSTSVTVTALCPGITNTDLVDDLKASEVPKFLMHAPREVAREGFDAMMRGDAIRIPGVGNQLTAAWSRWQPRSVVRYVTGLVSRFALDY
ncbi:MAG TPA: SDR family oxidoreductase [Pseudomonadales bacterium]|nr:SDR family oxidoreductase [Pseudomonadales bacterium]